MSLYPWALLPTWSLIPGITPTAAILYSIKTFEVIAFVHLLTYKLIAWSKRDTSGKLCQKNDTYVLSTLGKIWYMYLAYKFFLHQNTLSGIC